MGSCLYKLKEHLKEDIKVNNKEFLSKDKLYNDYWSDRPQTTTSFPKEVTQKGEKCTERNICKKTRIMFNNLSPRKEFN